MIYDAVTPAPTVPVDPSWNDELPVAPTLDSQYMPSTDVDSESAIQQDYPIPFGSVYYVGNGPAPVNDITSVDVPIDNFPAPWDITTGGTAGVNVPFDNVPAPADGISGTTATNAPVDDIPAPSDDISGTINSKTPDSDDDDTPVPAQGTNENSDVGDSNSADDEPNAPCSSATESSSDDSGSSNADDDDDTSNGGSDDDNDDNSKEGSDKSNDNSDDNSEEGSGKSDDNSDVPAVKSGKSGVQGSGSPSPAGEIDPSRPSVDKNVEGGPNVISPGREVYGGAKGDILANGAKGGFNTDGSANGGFKVDGAVTALGWTAYRMVA
ncbi:hypothetical protein PF008_g9107 [Phytophthora fragariae]|uniref:Uncharacterized protein n=1 Tax=Phytophthora fragariae TaxID=53985 RepID=A0A6G0RZB1_9STRA|nr:hypothetical protein PF008_g9107 [Phytophthora fragariae]